MKLKPAENDIDLYAEGFGGDDDFDRVKVGKRLSSLVERFTDPLVYSLDGRWGSGKSYFLQRWVGAHQAENDGQALTVYFDAYKSDYYNDPLPAIVEAIIDRVRQGDRGKSHKRAEFAASLGRLAARVGLAVATSGVSELATGVWKEAVDDLSAEAKAALDDLWKFETDKRKTLEALQNTLRKFADEAKDCPGASIVIVVDELDRCRPEYALAVLETIKHVFNVPKVHFVLGVNLEALEALVTTRYGDRINAEAYLRKFIDVRLRLPKTFGHRHAKVEVVLEYLENLLEDVSPSPVIKEVRAIVRLVSRVNQISFRDAQKIYAATVLLPDQVLNKENGMFPGYKIVGSGLLVAGIIDPKMHRKLIDLSFTEEELLSFLGGTKASVEKPDGVNYGPNHDYDIWQPYIVWMHLRAAAAKEEIGGEELSSVVQLFTDPGRVLENPESIPARIQADWLDLLEEANL